MGRILEFANIRTFFKNVAKNDANVLRMFSTINHQNLVSYFCFTFLSQVNLTVGKFIVDLSLYFKEIIAI